ncbi:hypothetical protein LEP1GSC017_1095 [Leptospira meyeri serovar Hardjo str. Went 5]|nr:hypothetical protein LEP1GSC017_1095 [Leptospira meyeri serovar Hardjo str. Went 5]
MCKENKKAFFLLISQNYDRRTNEPAKRSKQTLSSWIA